MLLPLDQLWENWYWWCALLKSIVVCLIIPSTNSMDFQEGTFQFIHKRFLFEALAYGCHFIDMYMYNSYIITESSTMFIKHLTIWVLQLYHAIKIVYLPAQKISKSSCWDVDVFCVSYKRKTCLFFNKHVIVEFVETGVVIKISCTIFSGAWIPPISTLVCAWMILCI